ncbi:MAG: hypothetical protein ACI8TP_000062 [Acidimicrobiales bacterium]|jgi:hypothetical protein
MTRIIVVLLAIVSIVSSPLEIAAAEVSATETVSATVSATETSPISATTADVKDSSTSAIVAARTKVDDHWRTEKTSNGWALPIDFLGWGSTLVASNDDLEFDLGVPHALGNRLDSIEFTATLTPFVDEGHVIVNLNGEEVSETLIFGNAPVYLRVALAGADAGSTVSIRVHPHHNACPVGDVAEIARLTTPVMFFTPAPVSIRSAAGNLLTPEVVAGVEFVVDEAHSGAVDQAVLSATSAFAHGFAGEQRFAVTEREPKLDAPFVTTIRIAERDEAAIDGDVVNARFVVTGRGEDLVNQAAGLVDAFWTLDDIDHITVESMVPVEREPLRRRGIEEVTGRLRASGASHLELPILLEQADFGGPVSSYRVRLGGVVSPTRSADASGIQLGLWVDDEVLEVLELDDNGRFDLEATIAGDRVGRTTVVRLVLDLDVSGCPSSDSLGIQLDRGSWIEPEAGQILQPGFVRTPQVFADSFAVDVGSTVSHLSAASDAVGLLQDTTTWLLQPVVVERDATISSGPVLVAGPDIELLDLLGAPLNNQSGRIDTGRATIATSTDVDRASTSALQVFVSSDGNDVLTVDAATHATFGLPDGLGVHRFRQINGSIVQLDDEGLVEVAGISITRDNSADDDLALGEIDREHAAALPMYNEPGAGNGVLARRELFALGLAASLLAAGLVRFGRRSVRAAHRLP